MKLKIGDRVKLRGTQYKGTVLTMGIPGYYVRLDKDTSAWYKGSSLIRLVKKKKPLGVKEYEQIIERATNALTEIDGSMWRIKSATVTRQHLAKAWDRFVWGNNHYTHASESILFEAFCRELGV